MEPRQRRTGKKTNVSGVPARVPKSVFLQHTTRERGHERAQRLAFGPDVGPCLRPSSLPWPDMTCMAHCVAHQPLATRLIPASTPPTHGNPPCSTPFSESESPQEKKSLWGSFRIPDCTILFTSTVIGSIGDNCVRDQVTVAWPTAAKLKGPITSSWGLVPAALLTTKTVWIYDRAQPLE